MIVKILFAISIALLLSAFQYLHKQKSHGLFVLRFFVYFTLFLLLANLFVTKEQEEIVKPDLFVLVDQSESIKLHHSGETAQNILDSLSILSLQEKFNIHKYGFGKNLFSLDTLSFNEKETKLYEAINQLNAIYDKKRKAPVILVTDGISTSETRYLPRNNPFEIYPVVVGDTTHYPNTWIEEINANRIAFKGNKFPMEVWVGYEGNDKIQSRVAVWHNKNIIASKNIKFKKPGLKKIRFLLPADSKGKQIYQVSIQAFPGEKNRRDNSKKVIIEIIDQQKRILILSSIVHPDIGLIKRQLALDKHIKTDFSLIDNPPVSLRPYSAVILYQPQSSFEKLFSREKLRKSSWLIITGTKTDWQWLNSKNLFFKKEVTPTFEEYFPLQNKEFELFELPSLSFEKYPPLKDYYGKVKFTNADAALFSKIRNIETEDPLLLFNKTNRQAVLLGENYWKWGVFSHKYEEKEKLDRFFQQIIQYISTHLKVNQIQLDYKRLYENGENIEIKARILNKNFQPDLKDQPVLQLYNVENKKIGEKLMYLDNDTYIVHLDNLPPGKYYFLLYSKKLNKKIRGDFEVNKQSREERSLRADYNQLKNLAGESSGKLYWPQQTDQLIKELSNTKKYPAQIITHSLKTPLIDYKILLFLLVLLLGIEWFIKKRKGKL